MKSNKSHIMNEYRPKEDSMGWSGYNTESGWQKLMGFSFMSTNFHRFVPTYDIVNDLRSGTHIGLKGALLDEVL